MRSDIKSIHDWLENWPWMRRSRWSPEVRRNHINIYWYVVNKWFGDMTKDRRKATGSKKGAIINIINVGSQGSLFERVSTESRVKPDHVTFSSLLIIAIFILIIGVIKPRGISLQNSLDKVTWILAKYCQTRARARKHTQPLANEIFAWLSDCLAVAISSKRSWTNQQKKLFWGLDSYIKKHIDLVLGMILGECNKALSRW